MYLAGKPSRIPDYGTYAVIRDFDICERDGLALTVPLSLSS